MIHCSEICELLCDLLDQELEMDFEEEVTGHISRCVTCQSVFRTYKKTVQLYEHMEMLDVPEETHLKLIKFIEIEVRRKSR